MACSDTRLPRHGFDLVTCKAPRYHYIPTAPRWCQVTMDRTQDAS